MVIIIVVTIIVVRVVVILGRITTVIIHFQPELYSDLCTQLSAAKSFQSCDLKASDSVLVNPLVNPTPNIGTISYMIGVGP